MLHFIHALNPILYNTYIFDFIINAFKPNLYYTYVLKLHFTNALKHIL